MNNDLVWSIEHFSKETLARQFVMQFENKICVFSPSVGQLYTNYSINFPQEENRNLVILPDPYAHHDTFQHIPEGAVQKTGLNIVPGASFGKKGLYILAPVKNATNIKPIPLQAGLKAIISRRTSNNPFLPVLMKGDLREFQSETPCLHLHALNMGKLGNVSDMDRRDICRVIEGRLKQFY